MFVEVGYSDNPDTAEAGRQAAREALERAGRGDMCDMVLLFATARHDAAALAAAVREVMGESVSVVGGGAVGAMTNDAYGYAGDQVALAAFWLTGVRCGLFVEEGLGSTPEVAAGRRLGIRLAESGVTPQSPVALFYDAIDSSQGGIRMVMATHFLHGLEDGLGFLPNLVGAGLLGDYSTTPTKQWTGAGISQHTALALTFSGDMRLDHVIMHGCRPATGYYTVTKADEQTILEIDGRPALEFMDTLLGGAIPVDSYPFFLILGVNRGEKWGDFDENSYASRLCLAIDKERNGIVMFEPDMGPGTEFQVMYRSLELDYMAPRIDALFDTLGDDRKPVFALYIDCAGRAAGYGGIDLEDAVVVQRKVNGRVPLLGIYTGVEIGSVQGSPRGLDWTGVFCLFSVPK